MKTSTRALLALAMVVAIVGGAGCLDTAPTAAADKNDKNAKKSGGQVIGKVGDKTFTLEDVDRAAMKSSLEAYQQVYDARRNALQGLIDEELLNRAAADKGVTLDELVESEIIGKTRAVTDEDVQNFFNQNQARMGGRTLEQVGGQIRDYLKAVNSNEARGIYLETLRAGAAIEMRIDPPRVEMVVADNDPAKGPPSAPVTIVEYSDFQ